MLPSSREIILHSAVSRMHLAQDDMSLQLIDNDCRLHKIDLESLKITKSTSLSHLYEHDLFDYYRRPFAITQHLAYISFSQKGVEHLVEVDSKILPIFTFSYNKNEQVSKAAFSENGNYLITGNEHGRAYVVSTLDGSLQADLPISSDVISAVEVSETYRLAARASFTKELVVYKLNTRSVIFEQKLDAVIEMMLFLDDRYLLAITRNSKLLKIDLYLQKIEKELLLDTVLWPSVFILSHSQKFLYVGTRESVLFAIHVKTLEILYHINLPYQGITTLARSKKYFIIGFKTGEVVFYNHREFETEFINHIRLRQIKEASLLFNKNIFLMTHRETKKIYEFWEEEKKTIMELLARGEIEGAQHIAEPYLFHPKCKLEFTDLSLLQPDLMSLHRYIRSFHFALAYQLVKLKPALKKSSLYATMEALWTKSFQKAQILLAREPIHNKESAKEALHLFEDVEEKQSIIENMLKRSGIFTLAENAAKEKNFAFYFKLVAQNLFLEYTPLYQKVLQIAERLQHEINVSLENRFFDQALTLADIFHQFSPYRHQANRLKEVSKALMILEDHLEHHRLFEAVKLQEQYRLQTNYAPIVTLEQLKIAFQEEQNRLLSTKHYGAVYANILPYMSLTVCRQNVANIMRQYYMSQLEDAIANTSSSIDWEKTFLEYCRFFPTDKILVEFAKRHGKMEVLQRISAIARTEESPQYPKTIVCSA
ncbi:MAG TPA: hypothetical protein CFH80_09185 [Sulfurospirillum cavolei]|uniref:WD40 repeat domain-containing protein n=1 Tax=Sulfurospirillum cavolei TaxID=366522 RepID=A0A2D3WBF1_9BACT|nr:MAG TPA: hypothetical protein CFH80_09185 [Sulfurospirillum cavolei]